MYEEYDMQCPRDLWLTQDAFGEISWTNLTQNANGQIAAFVDFEWAAKLCETKECKGVKKVRSETIFATTYDKPGDWDMAWDPDIHFVVSNDFFKSFSNKVACGNQFEVIGDAVYLARSNLCPTDIKGNPRKADPQYPQGITLYTSIDGGDSFEQVSGKWPLRKVPRRLACKLTK